MARLLDTGEVALSRAEYEAVQDLLESSSNLPPALIELWDHPERFVE